jgi:hypothetical protein
MESPRPSLANVLTDAVVRAGNRRVQRDGRPDVPPAAAADDHSGIPSAEAGWAETVPAPAVAGAALWSADGGTAAAPVWPRFGWRLPPAYRVGFGLAVVLLAASVVANVSLLRRPPAQGEFDAGQPSEAQAAPASSIKFAPHAAMTAPKPVASAVAAKTQPAVTHPSPSARAMAAAAAPQPATSHDGAPAATVPGKTASREPIKAAEPLPPAIVKSAEPSPVVKPAASAESRPAPPPLPASEVRVLVARGDALLGSGDVTSARLFYRRAADGGDGTAALRLGESFDPAFLQQAGLGRIGGDLRQAFFWYRRAQALGNRSADPLLKMFEPASR